MPNWPMDTESTSLAYQYLEQILPGKYIWNVILASFLIFINAVQINHIVIKNRISREINLFPGMIFIFLTALHVEMFWLSPQLISITFLLMGVSNIYRIYQRPNVASYIFNSGLFIGVASLIYLPYILFLSIAVVSIVTLRKFKILDFFQLIVAFILPFVFLLFIWFWNDLEYNRLLDIQQQMHLNNFIVEPKIHELIIFTLLLLLIIQSLLDYRKNTIKKSIQSQKKVNIFYWQMFIALLTVPFVSADFLFDALLVLFIPLSVFISMMFNRIKNETALELLHLFILFFIIFSHFWFN